jgi:hypothetical protein
MHFLPGKRSLIVLLAVALWVAPASAATITFYGSSGTLAASAAFTPLSGGNLQVVLTNTSTADVLVPTDVLTAVFWSGTSGLTPVSATLSGGSTVFFGPDGGGNVGGEWAYAASLSGAPQSAFAGISSSGFGLFGNGNFGGNDLMPPASVDGLQYGITSALDDTTTGNAAVTGGNQGTAGNALIKNQVTFILSGASGLKLSDINNVSFQYGTALCDPNVPSEFYIITEPIPVPPSALLLGSGLLGLGLIRWRRREKKA